MKDLARRRARIARLEAKRPPRPVEVELGTDERPGDREDLAALMFELLDSADHSGQR